MKDSEGGCILTLSAHIAVGHGEHRAGLAIGHRDDVDKLPAGTYRGPRNGRYTCTQ